MWQGVVAVAASAVLAAGGATAVTQLTNRSPVQVQQDRDVASGVNPAQAWRPSSTTQARHGTAPTMRVEVSGIRPAPRASSGSSARTGAHSAGSWTVQAWHGPAGLVLGVGSSVRDVRARLPDHVRRQDPADHPGPADPGMRRAASALIPVMTPGLAVLVGALVVAVVGGTVWRRANGRMRSPRGRAGAGASVPLSPQVLQGAGIAGRRSTEHRHAGRWNAGHGARSAHGARSGHCARSGHGARSWHGAGPEFRAHQRPARACPGRAGDAGAVFVGLLRAMPGDTPDPGRRRRDDRRRRAHRDRRRIAA